MRAKPAGTAKRRSTGTRPGRRERPDRTAPPTRSPASLPTARSSLVVEERRRRRTSPTRRRASTASAAWWSTASPYSPKIAIGNGTAGLSTDGSGGLIPSPLSDAIIEATALGDEANVTLGLCPDTAKVVSTPTRPAATPSLTAASRSCSTTRPSTADTPGVNSRGSAAASRPSESRRAPTDSRSALYGEGDSDPMLAKPAAIPGRSSSYAYEPKWDGFRPCSRPSTDCG